MLQASGTGRPARTALALAATAATLLTACGGEPKPDARLIAFTRAPATNAFADVYLLQTDGSMRRLTHGGIDSAPVWSPDGRQIAFQRAQRGPGSQLYVANADGSGERLLPGAVAGTVDWAPDGRHLVFTYGGTIHATNEEWSEHTVLVGAGDGRASEPRWSPDGTRIVFVLARGDGGADVWTMNADGRGRTRLTRLPAGEGVPDSPAWSPDGRRLLFLLPGSLHVMNADGTAHEVLVRFPEGIFPSTPTWSPDSREIAYARLKLGRDRRASGLYLVDVESREQHRLTRDVDSSPSWSPDGRQIVFQRLTGFHISEITLMDRDGSNQVSLTQGGWSDSSPVWRPRPQT